MRLSDVADDMAPMCCQGCGEWFGIDPALPPHERLLEMEKRHGLPDGEVCNGVPADEVLERWGSCDHPDFRAVVDVIRIDEGDGLEGLMIEVSAGCVECGVPLLMHGRGLQTGLDPRRPSMSIDGAKAIIPCRPASSDPAFGKGLPGLAMRIHQANEHGDN